MSVADNVGRIMDRIRAAQKRSGRSDTVHLMAVIKFVPPAAVDEAVAAGVRLLGENKVQEALMKKPQVRGEADWHLIGHLQTNKASKAAELFSCVQSVDSIRVAAALQKACEKASITLNCLLEIKVSPEPSKAGVALDAVPSVLNELAACNRLAFKGLMTLAPYEASPENARPYFRAARACWERCLSAFGPEPVLSMGMSNDFEVAVEEGSTLVRIGKALFGPRPSPA